MNAPSASTSGRDSFSVVSTFSGCGGSSLGYKWAGGDVRCAVEIDDAAVRTYSLNFPETPILHRDIAQVSVEDVQEAAHLVRGELDVLDGSPPCQGFSMAGQRVLEDPRNDLFNEFVRLLDGLQPRVFVMENVSGMVKGKMRIVFVEILRTLRASGYRVKASRLDAQFFGVPQSRQRIIFIGVREDLAIDPTHPRAETKPTTARAALASVETSDEEIKMLLAAGRRYAAYKYWHLVQIGRTVQDVTGKAGFSGCKWHPDRVGRTVPRNDGNITMHGSMHWAERRRFSVPEYKRLGTFPDEFLFPDGFKESVHQIGNCVPPRFMEAIARHVRDNLLNVQGVAGMTRTDRTVEG